MSEGRNNDNGKNNLESDDFEASGEELSIVSDADNGESSLDGDIQKLIDECDKYKNEFLYLRAEFDNYKKQALKERSDLLKYGAERLISNLLNVLDNFDRALETKTDETNFADFCKGIELTRSDLFQMLEGFGVKKLNSEHQAFDPNLHEALSSEETDAIPPGHILRVFKPAYKLHDKLIRPAQVVVAKEPSSSGDK